MYGPIDSTTDEILFAIVPTEIDVATIHEEVPWPDEDVEFAAEIAELLVIKQER